MTHEMHLNPLSFEKIKSGSKTAEIRLYDEKRKNIWIGDFVVFHKLPDSLETITTQVVGIEKFNSLYEAYKKLGPQKAGFEGMSATQAVENTRYAYSEEEEKKYGVIVLLIKLVK